MTETELVADEHHHISELKINIGKRVKTMKQCTKGDSFCTQFNFLDLKGIIYFYPKGNEDASDGHTSIMIEFDAKKTDKRKIRVTVRHFNDKWALDLSCASSWNTGWGWNNFIVRKKIKTNSQFIIAIEMDANEIKERNVVQNKVDSVKQMEAMYEYGTKHGDISIVVNEVYDNEINEISEPPHKKRKIETEETETVIIKTISNILKTESPVFAAMLENKMQEKRTKKIHIAAYDADDVDNMIYFLFTKQLKYDDFVYLKPLMDLAKLYQIKSLERKCWEEMLEELQVSHFVETVCCFDKYRITEGYDILIEFAKENLEDIREEDNFHQLSHSFQYLVCGKRNK